MSLFEKQSEGNDLMTKQEIREALYGPIPTIQTPFNKTGEIDYKALSKMIDFDLQAGAKAIVLTAGDSHLVALSDREMAALTKATAQQVQGRGLMVAADRYFDTKQSVAFAKYSAGLGVDVLMVLPPDWALSCTVETMACHYATVAQHIPVMMVTNVFNPRGAAFGLNVVRRALELSDNIVAIKDDMCGSFAHKLTALAAERCAVWAGGLKEDHLNMALYGRIGYLSTFITFKPEVAWQYWNAYIANDLQAASHIVSDIEWPLFDFIAGFSGGFDAAMHGMLELYGLSGRWRPKPYYSLDDAEMEKLADFLRSKRLL